MINQKVLIKRNIFHMTFFIYLSLTLNFLYGQNTTIVDSLLDKLSQQVNIDRVDTLNELAWELRKNDSEHALDYATKAKLLSNSLNYREGYLTSLNRIGTIYIYQKKFEKAEFIYQDILSNESKLNNEYGIGRAYNQLGLIYTQKGALNQALRYTLKAEQKFEKLGKNNIVAITSNNIGDLNRQLGNYEIAMQYFLKSLELKKKQKNKEAIALTLQNIGLFQLEIGNNDKALNYLYQSKLIFEQLNDKYELAKVFKNIGSIYFKNTMLDSAYIFYQKSIALKKELDIGDRDADIYNNLGVIYHKKYLYDDALNSYNEALKIHPTSNIYNNIGHLYYEKEDYLNSIFYYQRALEKANISERKLDQMDALNNLSDANSKLGKFDVAMRYNQHYLKLRDSLELKYKNATNLKINYEEQQKQKALLEKQEAENQSKEILIYSLIAGIVLISLLFFAVLRGNKQKQLAKIAEKNRLIESQRVEELLKNQELKSMNAMMVGQEEERKRIARDLHDRLGSMLAMVKNHFKSVETSIDSIKDANTTLYKKANSLLDEACEEVRKISQDMASGVLTKFGLTAALEDLKVTLEESKRLEVEFIAHGLSERLPLELEITIYRIIQELISNILKHAKSSEISIQLLKSKNGLNIIVEDNGVGFNTDNNNTGMGLKNIQSRVDSLNGELKIDSTFKKGTTVTIDIPLNRKAND